MGFVQAHLFSLVLDQAVGCLSGPVQLSHYTHSAVCVRMRKMLFRRPNQGAPDSVAG